MSVFSKPEYYNTLNIEQFITHFKPNTQTILEKYCDVIVNEKKDKLYKYDKTKKKELTDILESLLDHGLNIDHPNNIPIQSNQLYMDIAKEYLRKNEKVPIVNIIQENAHSWYSNVIDFFYGIFG